MLIVISGKTLVGQPMTSLNATRELVALLWGTDRDRDRDLTRVRFGGDRRDDGLPSSQQSLRKRGQARQARGQ
jgi:hypothetical protein